MHCTPDSPEGLSSWARAPGNWQDTMARIPSATQWPPGTRTLPRWAGPNETEVWKSELIFHPVLPRHHWRRPSSCCSPKPSCLGGSGLAAELGDNDLSYEAYLSLICQFSFFHSHIIESIMRQWSVFQHHLLLLKGGRWARNRFKQQLIHWVSAGSNTGQ